MKSAKAFKWLALSGLSFADTCNGRWTNVTISSETQEVAKGHTITFFVARGSATSDNSPLNAVGECGGYFLAMPDGQTRTVDICTRKGKDGDTESDVWSMEPGAERGTWKVVSGTGAFDGKSFSGWWQPLVEDGKTTTGSWGGECK